MRGWTRPGTLGMPAVDHESPLTRTWCCCAGLNQASQALQAGAFVWRGAPAGGSPTGSSASKGSPPVTVTVRSPDAPAGVRGQIEQYDASWYVNFNWEAQ